MHNKKKIIKKSMQIGASTLLSRLFGIAREMLMIRYLGVTIASDAFVTAFKIPNSLRKVFAEGALSAAFIPSIVRTIKTKNKEAASKLITFGFLVFELILLLLCIVCMLGAKYIAYFIAPGFSHEQAEAVIPLIRILMPLILFYSSSSLLASALQAAGQYFVPAFSQTIVNILFIASILTCLQYNLSVDRLCWFLLIGGFVQFAWHLVTYFRLQFSFTISNMNIYREEFKNIFYKFLWGLPSAGFSELNYIIDSNFASFLAPGSSTLIYYADRFFNIPIGIFAIALATVLLSHFSHIASYSRKRFNFYLLEAAKLIFWVTIPTALLMSFFAEKIFHTMFLSDKFDLIKVIEASHILIASLIGLSFAALNRILLSMYYALHDTKTPAIISVAAMCVNLLGNLVFIYPLQATGLALATTISWIVQTMLYLLLLNKKFNVKVHLAPFGIFLVRYCAQLLLLAGPFILIYRKITQMIETLSPNVSNYFLYKIGFWFWVTPLCAIFILVLFFSRRAFNIRLYFLDA